jgi:hypothetical protein
MIKNALPEKSEIATGFADKLFKVGNLGRTDQVLRRLVGIVKNDFQSVRR